MRENRRPWELDDCMSKEKCWEQEAWDLDTGTGTGSGINSGESAKERHRWGKGMCEKGRGSMVVKSGGDERLDVVKSGGEERRGSAMMKRRGESAKVDLEVMKKGGEWLSGVEKERRGEAR